MRFDFAQHHLLHRHTESTDSTEAVGLSRRDAIKQIGAVGAAAAVAGSLVSADAVSAGGSHHAPSRGPYTDDMFDIEAAEAGAWAPGPYGAGDQRGSFNELTPERTARAMRRLNLSKPVKSYQLGEELYNGFPAYPSSPPRLHEMYLYAFGYEAPADFVAGGGIQSGKTPLGHNQLTGHEERFAQNYTFQIATQIDGLPHIGIGQTYYNGFQATDFITPTGTSMLGNETMGPVATRGVIIDVVGLKVANGDTDTYFTYGGKPVLNGNYRITIADIEWALSRQHIRRGIGPGDVPILHTGWTHLKSDQTLYLSQEPGIYLAEARYFADRKVAIVATDTWGLEVLDPALTQGNAFPCHQELITKNGVRIGESFVTDAAIADHCYEGVFIATPQNVPGATCGSSPPMLLGQPGRAPR